MHVVRGGRGSQSASVPRPASAAGASAPRAQAGGSGPSPHSHAGIGASSPGPRPPSARDVRCGSSKPADVVYSGPSAPPPARVTLRTLRRKYARGEPLTMVTAYDYPSAVHVDQSGIDMLLVGDSAAMVVHGHDTTLPITLEEMLGHCRAVARGARRPFLVGDLPFGSFEESPAAAVRAAVRLLKEGGVDAVKIEGARVVLGGVLIGRGVQGRGRGRLWMQQRRAARRPARLARARRPCSGNPGPAPAKPPRAAGGEPARVDTIRAVVRAGIAVMGHVGLTPQSVSVLGGFRPAGLQAADAALLVEQAKVREDVCVCVCWGRGGGYGCVCGSVTGGCIWQGCMWVEGGGRFSVRVQGILALHLRRAGRANGPVSRTKTHPSTRARTRTGAGGGRLHCGGG